ncbi:hypothetical protein C5167_012885 [Papaver somniferum]|uniref:LysM domain-containing protein n=1 Tax=Papaver somniferum TaxID=3469 RepID=A0A4Y7J260_PAPSO|nr:uncharacterized protein LOC113361209 [Papaver somniferum]RZC54031.1 hypothetical protein C5167_012885 [Papaver somniferum]
MANLTHKPDISSFISRVFHPTTRSSLSPFNPITYKFSLESLGSKKVLLIKRFQGLAQKWDIQVQETFKGAQSSTNQLLVHIVRGGENLTSISRRYNVSVQAIAAVNSNIVDIDLVFEGQRLNIPRSRFLDAQMGARLKSWSYLNDVHKRYQTSFNTLVGHANHKVLPVLSPHQLLLAKTTGYILLLVPVVAVCIRYVIHVFHANFTNWKRQGLNQPKGHNFGSRSIRWKTALRDIREPEGPEASDSEVNQEYESPQEEDQSEVLPFEGTSHDYTHLEPAYQKFLLECGISESGYWRGGSSK